MSARVAAALLAVAAAPGLAAADGSDDGYCDYIEGTADATAAPLLAPEAFAQFGYIEQPAFAVTPSTSTNDLRVIGGVRYSLTNVYTGLATKARARAECKRHRALTGLTDATEARALTARVKVYDDADAEAQRLLHEQQQAVDTRQGTAQDLLATRMRVEELRTLAADARRDLAALPAPETRPLASVLASYREADATVERNEAKLRTVRAYDVGVRFGVDRFLQGSTETRFFGVLEVGVNLGALWTGGANRRAAAGRARYAQTDPQLLAGKTFDQLRGSLEVEQKLVEQTAALVADLDRQLQAVAQITGEDGRRFRETLWFAWVKASADLAYQRAHIESLGEVLAAAPR